MQDNAQKQILKALLVFMKPVARILLRHNIGFREFSEVAKVAMVDVATSEYGIRGRPTNISRVAVMTGLTRKEVRRLRDQLMGDEETFTVKSTPLAAILHHWFKDPEFLDEGGSPAELPFAGEKGSFASLVRRFGGDIPPGAMRTELKRVGAVEESDDGSLRVVRRSIRPSSQVDKLCMSLSHGAYAFLSNIAENSAPDRDTTEPGWVQRTVFSATIRKSDATRLRRMCDDKIKAVAESIDDLFMAYELDEQQDSHDDYLPVAVTMGYFEEQDDNLRSLWTD